MRQIHQGVFVLSCQRVNTCRTVSAEALQVLLVVVRIGIISNTDVLLVPGMEECSRKEVNEHMQESVRSG